MARGTVNPKSWHARILTGKLYTMKKRNTTGMVVVNTPRAGVPWKVTNMTANTRAFPNPRGIARIACKFGDKIQIRTLRSFIPVEVDVFIQTSVAKRWIPSSQSPVSTPSSFYASQEPLRLGTPPRPRARPSARLIALSHRDPYAWRDPPPALARLANARSFVPKRRYGPLQFY